MDWPWVQQRRVSGEYAQTWSGMSLGFTVCGWLVYNVVFWSLLFPSPANFELQHEGPWIGLPGFHCEMIRFCFSHNVNLGFYHRSNASALPPSCTWFHKENQKSHENNHSRCRLMKWKRVGIGSFSTLRGPCGSTPWITKKNNVCMFACSVAALELNLATSWS